MLLRILLTLAIVVVLLASVLGTALSPLWLLPVNVICQLYLGYVGMDALVMIWCPRAWAESKVDQQ